MQQQPPLDDAVLALVCATVEAIMQGKGEEARAQLWDIAHTELHDYLAKLLRNEEAEARRGMRCRITMAGCTEIR
jgi:hypothetical protein